jgi:hypothetical protein
LKFSKKPFTPLSDFDDDEDAGSKIQDQETKAMLFDGASVSQLGRLFNHDNRTVAKKIQGLRPVAKRSGHPIYSIAEAARYLVIPLGDIEDHIRKMRPEDLPPVLMREFWAGQTARQNFEENQGDLWRTSDVMAHLSKTFMAMRTALLLLPDMVEKSVELTDKQRGIVQRGVDGAMKELHHNLIGMFENEPERTFDEAQDQEAGEEPERTSVPVEDDPTADL